MKDIKVTLAGRLDGRRLSGSISVHRRVSGYQVSIKCNDREATKTVTEKQYAVLRVADIVGWLDPVTN